MSDVGSIDFEKASGQIIYFDGCSTFLDSSRFFSTKKKKNYALFTNALPVFLSLSWPAVQASTQFLLESLEGGDEVDLEDYLSTLESALLWATRSDEDTPLLNYLSF